MERDGTTGNYPQADDFNPREDLPLPHSPPHSTSLPMPSLSSSFSSQLETFPTDAYCRFCKRTVMTRVKRAPSLTSYSLLVLLVLLGCWLGCCLLPLGYFKTIKHECTQCEAGIEKRYGW